MEHFRKREVDYYLMPLPNDFTAIHIEKVVIQFAEEYSMDFGAMCYLSRSNAQRSRKHGKLVNFDSFNKRRAQDVRKLIHLAVEMFHNSGLRIKR